ncbi:hypothetical protein D3C78_1899600 [compost metagenome]
MANQSGELIISDKNFAKFDVVDPGESVNFTSVVEIESQEFLVTAFEGLAKVTQADRKMVRILKQE